MTDREKMFHYEVNIVDMLKVLQERLDEFGDGTGLDDFESGRHLAYMEVMDIIKTRYSMILELIEEDDE